MTKKVTLQSINYKLDYILELLLRREDETVSHESQPAEEFPDSPSTAAGSTESVPLFEVIDGRIVLPSLQPVYIRQYLDHPYSPPPITGTEMEAVSTLCTMCGRNQIEHAGIIRPSLDEQRKRFITAGADLEDHSNPLD
jgi:hypothetical protein